MKKRIIFDDEGQELQFLDIDEETGRIYNVSSECSAALANIYIGGIVDVSAIQEGRRLSISDSSNAGKLFHTRHYVAGVESL